LTVPFGITMNHTIRILSLLFVFLLSPIGWAQESLGDADPELTSRLRAAFRQVEDLGDITLEVRGGVAVLRGKVPSLEKKIEAQKLALKVEGILTVDNGIEVDTSVSNRLGPAFTRLYKEAYSILSILPLLVLAGGVFFVIFSFGSLISRWNGLYSRFSKNLFAQNLYKQITQMVFFLVGAVVALEILGATQLVAALLGAAGVLGIALGFAFRDVAENALASFLLGMRQPFEPNDLVNVNGHEGRVIRLTSRATILLTLDGNHVRIPNSEVFKATIINYTRNPGRRFSFGVRVDAAENIPRVQALALKLLSEAPGVLQEPAPQCRVDALGDFGTELVIYAWVDQKNFDYFKVKSESVRIIKEGYDGAGVVMPGPAYTISQPTLTEQAEKTEITDLEQELEASPDVSVDRHLEELVQDERERAAYSDYLKTDGKIE
jgi:small conductance mechanosensitive channel